MKTKRYLDDLVLLDLSKPRAVEVIVRNDGKVLWVNVDGLCRLRICGVKKLTVEDGRRHE